MTDIADYLEAEIIDWLFGGTSFDTAPGTVYVGLHTSAPGDDGQSGEISTTSTGYSRQGVSTGSGFNQPSPNQAENASEIRFGPATSDWGDVSHVSLWDSASGGNALAVGDLNSTRTILTDDEVRFDAGDISFSLD